ncbi:MAG: 4Fe-4S dicluster domain-containing protein [Phascolarctobacterium sp.]|nr:4Fe-4S dicluster domain-containing protein [Phascolarctobacterium sp.]
MVVTEQEKVQAILELASTDIAACIQCGKCSACCPMGDKMDLLPSRIVWELKSGRAEDILKATSPWKCLSCFACETRCPRKVSPARLMEALRLYTIRQQGNNKIAIEDLQNYDEAMPQQALVAALRKYNK